MAAPRRPDPQQGVFETLLVLDGHPVELDAHLARLRASLATLYPKLTPPRLDVPVEIGPRTSTGTSTDALRITVAPTDHGVLRTTIERRPASGHFAPDIGGKTFSEPVSLRGLRLRGGLGAHKWADRSLLDEAQAGLPDDALPLIVDEDGSVLEASRANVFVVRDEALFTPPLDGRILPGITRDRVLGLATSLGIETEEGPLARKDLLGADEVFLTGSVRGIESAAVLDEATLPDTGPLAAELAAELRRAWLSAPATQHVG